MCGISQPLKQVAGGDELSADDLKQLSAGQKLGDVEGESSDDKHKDEIDIHR